MSLEQIKRQAQAAANREGKPYGVFNLNRIGTAMYVIRDIDAFPGENRMVARVEPKQATAS